MVIRHFCFLSALVACTAGATEKTETLAQALLTEGIKADIDDSFLLKKRKERKGADLKFIELRAEDGKGGVLEAELTSPLDKSKAEFLVKTRTLVVKGAYGKKPTPYEGEITNTSSCPAKFLPRNEKQGNRHLVGVPMSARVTERLLWGNCSPDGASKTGTLAFFYNDEKKTLLRLTLFQAETSGSAKTISRLIEGISFK